MAWALLLVTLVLVGVWVVRRTTWYLAIDQFGYLTFAEDLSHGRALHEWPLSTVMLPVLPANADVDVYAQTYVRRGGALFCRYSPGFPLVLAGVRLAFGPAAEHLVNPLALLLLLGCCYAIARRALSSTWLALGAALLVALLPNYVLLWSTSPLRDVPAHLFALGGLFVLLPGGTRLRDGWREALAGALLGFAITTRIDALLYLLPAGALGLLSRSSPSRRLVMAGCGFAAGIAPLLAYNYVATGNPLRPTQAMEVNSLLSRRQAPSADGWWREILPLDAVAAEVPAVVPAQDGPAVAPEQPASLGKPAPRPTPFLVQGGGLRLSHLASTLPANLIILREALGDLGIMLALLGAVTALRSPVLFLLVVPYAVVAILFFSMWTLPGARYLTGVLLLSPLLILHGARSAAVLPAKLAQRGMPKTAVLSALGLAFLLAFASAAPSSGVPSALPWVTAVLAGSVALAGVAGALRRDARPEVLVAMAIGLGLSVTLIWRSTTALGTRASFQRPQVERARAVVDGALEGKAVVLTTTRIGRPAENINYYTSAEAVYFEELHRWQAAPSFMVARLIRYGFSVYLLLTPEDTREFLANPNLSPWYAGEVVRTIAPEQAADYFVASPFHRGIPLLLVRLRLKPNPS